MKKLLKIVGGIVLGIVVLALLLVLTLPLWLGPVVKPIANAAVPNVTKTSFNLGHLYLNPYTGRFELGDMRLGNPVGYDEPTAVSVDNLVVDVAMTTLGDKYVHVEEVTVDGVFVSLVNGGANNVDNMTQIQYNVAGGKEAYELKQAEAEAALANLNAMQETLDRLSAEYGEALAAQEDAEAQVESAKKRIAEIQKEIEDVLAQKIIERRSEEIGEIALSAADGKILIDMK